jgi:hypothetical protein
LFHLSDSVFIGFVYFCVLRAERKHGVDVGCRGWSHGLRAAAVDCWRRQGGHDTGMMPIFPGSRLFASWFFLLIGLVHPETSRFVDDVYLLLSVALFVLYTFALQKGNSALMLAAWEGRVDCVRLLLDAGAKKEAKNQVRRFVGSMSTDYCRVCDRMRMIFYRCYG